MGASLPPSGTPVWSLTGRRTRTRSPTWYTGSLRDKSRRSLLDIWAALVKWAAASQAISSLFFKAWAVWGEAEVSASVSASAVLISVGGQAEAVVSGSVPANRRMSAGVRSSRPSAKNAGLSLVTSCGVARNKKFSQGMWRGQSAPSCPVARSSPAKVRLYLSTSPLVLWW